MPSVWNPFAVFSYHIGNPFVESARYLFPFSAIQNCADRYYPRKLPRDKPLSCIQRTAQNQIAVKNGRLVFQIPRSQKNLVRAESVWALPIRFSVVPNNFIASSSDMAIEFLFASTWSFFPSSSLKEKILK